MSVRGLVKRLDLPSPPKVYLMIIPGFGTSSHVISTFTDKAVFGRYGVYRAIRKDVKDTALMILTHAA